MKPIAKVSDFLENTLFPICLLAILVILCTDIYLRNFFQTGLIWGYDANSYLLLVCVFSIIPTNAQHNSHLKVDLFRNLYSPQQARWVDNITHVIGTTLFLLLGYQSVISSWEMHRYEETPEMFDFPLWILGGFMCLSSFLCSLIHLSRLLRPHTSHN